MVELEECNLRIHIIEEMLEQEKETRQKFLGMREMWKVKQREKEVDQLIVDGYLHTYVTVEECARDLANILNIPYKDLIIRVNEKWRELKGENG